MPSAPDPGRAAEAVVDLAGGTGDSAVLQQAIKQCYQGATSAALEERSRMVRVLTPAISVADEDRAWAVAYLCGALIEDGADPTPLHEPLLGRLTRIVASARRFHHAVFSELPAEPDDPDEAWEEAAGRIAPAMPVEARAFQRLEEAFAPAVALLSASATARRQARGLLPELVPMDDVNPGASWLAKLIAVLDDEPYMALEPATRQGIVGRMGGITENFQLHVLLMDAFPRGRWSRARVSRAAVATARGEGPQQLEETVHGAWNLHTWRAARTGLSEGTEETALANWIWNEGKPADIPVFEGRRVVLLGPPSLERSWNAQRDFARLEARLTVDATLSAAEVDEWLDLMRAAA